MVAGGDGWHADVFRSAAVAVGDLLTFLELEPEVLTADSSLMTEESVTKTGGTKGKSCFQITKVETGTVEEDGDDGDEDGDDMVDEDGEEENFAEKNETVGVPSVDQVDGSVVKSPLDCRIQPPISLQSSSTSSLANGPSNSSTASKFRVVRITKNTLNKKYTRGRWHCCDYTEPESAQHSPNDHEHYTLAGDTPKQEPTQETRTFHLFAEPSSHGGNRVGCAKGEVRRACDDLLGAAVAVDLSNYLAEVGRPSNARRGGDLQGRPLGNEDQSGRDRVDQVLFDVRNLILDYSSCEQREREAMREKNAALEAHVQHLQARERQLLSDVEDVRADFHRLLEENRRLAMQLSMIRDQH